MVVCLVSAKGSPGVTTAAAALAAVGAEQRAEVGESQGVDLVELDPAGGDIEPLTGVIGEAGLLRAVTDLTTASVVDQAVEAPPGVRSLLAPTSGFEASSTIGAGLTTWVSVLADLGGVVVVDAGRWESTHPLASRVAGSDVVGVVCRSDVRGVEHARHVVDRLRSVARTVAVITVGERPYGVDEIAGVLGVARGGGLVWDPGGVAALWHEGVTQRRFRHWPRSWLARSARGVLAGLVGAIEERAEVPVR
jgi:MinD-like ATPase involved in chromosome partitioning or flagellar assembly